MKKTLLLVTLSLLVSMSSMAQFGIKAGMNLAKMSDIDSDNEKFLNNFHFGVFMDKDIVPLLDLRFGLNYSPKGYRVEADDDNYAKATLNYLEIPVLAKVKLGPLYALGGVYGAYALNGKTELAIAGNVDKDDIDFDNSETSKMDFGMMFGLGVQFGLGPVHIFAQGDYSFGLMNLNTGEGDASKNSVVGVSVGVILGM